MNVCFGACRLVRIRSEMHTIISRRTVDLSQFPDLVVICLGMQVNRLTGLLTLLGLAPFTIATEAEGLLRDESVVFSLRPMNIGTRQYWRDMDSLLRWTRSEPHRKWWQGMLKKASGIGFWHEAYFRRGGMEGIYNDMPQPIGFTAFAPIVAAEGRMHGAEGRAQAASERRVLAKETEWQGK